jgi:hypothetical protein
MRKWLQHSWWIAGIALVLLLHRFPPGHARFYPACPFHSMTGWNCPGCGSTRAFAALLHGDVIGALTFNPLLPLFALAAMIFWIYRARLQHHERATAYGLAFSLVLVTAARNVFHF